MVRLLDVPALADLLRVTPQMIRRLIQTAGLPHLRLGRVIRFHPASVESWLLGLEEAATGAAELQLPMPTHHPEFEG